MQPVAVQLDEVIEEELDEIAGVRALRMARVRCDAVSAA
jgi:hypothetical protein